MCLLRLLLDNLVRFFGVMRSSPILFLFIPKILFLFFIEFPLFVWEDKQPVKCEFKLTKPPWIFVLQFGQLKMVKDFIDSESVCVGEILIDFLGFLWPQNKKQKKRFFLYNNLHAYIFFSKRLKFHLIDI